MSHKYEVGATVTYKGELHVIVERSAAGARYKLAKPDKPKVAITGGALPLQVGPTGKEVDFAFPLSELTAVDVHNGECKLEFLRERGGRRMRDGPLVVLKFHEKGVLTVGQWKFIEALSARLEKYGQKTEGDADQSGVRLGLQNEIEWLPQRYTSNARWLQRVALLLFALAAAVAPARQLHSWVMSSSLDVFAEVLALNFDVVHWLWSGFKLIKTLFGGVNKLMARGKAVYTEEDLTSPPATPAAAATGGDKKRR